jgi:hypothetical protein
MTSPFFLDQTLVPSPIDIRPRLLNTIQIDPMVIIPLMDPMNVKNSRYFTNFHMKWTPIDDQDQNPIPNRWKAFKELHLLFRKANTFSLSRFNEKCQTMNSPYLYRIFLAQIELHQAIILVLISVNYMGKALHMCKDVHNANTMYIFNTHTHTHKQLRFVKTPYLHRLGACP